VLGDVLTEVESRQKTLTVFNYDGSRRLTENIRQYFSLRNVEVTTGQTRPVSPSNFVLLHEDGRILAASDLSDLREHLLADSTAAYVRGEKPLDTIDYPDVLTRLDDTVFTVSGAQTLLMVKVSRYIEGLAGGRATGTLRTGFQDLDRLTDEPGTRRVYRRLTERGVDVHAYGHPGDPATDGGTRTDRPTAGDSTTPASVTTHAEPVPELADCWFVVYDGGDRPERAAALLAEKREDGFYGFWTFETETVERIDAYLDRAY
jgi:hypothetical protein